MCNEHETRVNREDEFYDYLSELKTGDKKGVIIPLLQKMQLSFGYIPKDVVFEASKQLGIPVSDIYSVATFYSQFSFVPKGKYEFNVCLGTACYVKGAGAVLRELENCLGIKDGETSEDGNFSIGTTRCVGACGLAPVISINGKVYGKVTPDQIKKLVKDLQSHIQEDIKE